MSRKENNVFIKNETPLRKESKHEETENDYCDYYDGNFILCWMQQER